MEKKSSSKNFKSFSFSLHADTITQIKDVTKKLNLTSVSELFRIAWREYYENNYRKNYLGNQAGLLTSGGKLSAAGKREEIDRIVNEIKSLENDEDINKILEDIGYIASVSDGTSSFAVRTNEVNQKMFTQFTSSGQSDRYTQDELATQVRKFLKSK